MLPWARSFLDTQVHSRPSQDCTGHPHHMLSNPGASSTILSSVVEGSENPASNTDSNALNAMAGAPIPDKKPLLAADTLYDTTLYSSRALEATYPFTQRVEYDHTNPLTIPSDIAHKCVITAYPTLYPAAYHANILVDDDNTAKHLYSTIHSQFNRQLSPFYLLYRSTDNIPRVITKDQIPNLMDASKSHEPFYQPVPLVSLPIPTIMALPQNAYTTPHVASSVLTSLAITRVIQPMVSFQPPFLRDINTNLLQFKDLPPRLFSVMGQTRTQSLMIPPTVLGNLLTWVPYFELRSFFLSRLSLPKGESSSGADLNNVYALNTHIFSKTSDHVYNLQMALSLKAPDLFSSPIERTLASYKAALVTSVCLFPFIMSQYYTQAHHNIMNCVGLLPESYQRGVAPGKHVVVATRTGAEQMALPTHGLINKTLYEAFYYDHVRPHIYLIHQQKVFDQKYPGIATFLRDLWKPTEYLTQRYNEIIGRDYAKENPQSGAQSLSATTTAPKGAAATPSSAPSPSPSAAAVKPVLSTHSSPLNLPTAASRMKFFGRGFLAVQLMWVHFHLALFTYEYVKKTEFSTSGRSSYLSRGSSTKDQQNHQDLDFARLLNSVPNNLVQEYSAEYAYDKYLARKKQEEEQRIKKPWYKRLFKSYSATPAGTKVPIAGDTVSDTTITAVTTDDINTTDATTPTTGTTDDNNTQSTKAPETNTPELVSKEVQTSDEKLTEKQKRKKRKELLKNLPSMPSVSAQGEVLPHTGDAKIPWYRVPFTFAGGLWKRIVAQDETNPSTSTYGNKIAFSAVCAIFASILTGNVMYPMINSFDHQLVRKIMGRQQLSRWVGLSLFNTRFTLLHTILLIKIAGDDYFQFKRVADYTKQLVNTKSRYYKESSSITSPVNLSDAPQQQTSSLSSIQASIASDDTFIPLHTPHLKPAAFQPSHIRLDYEQHQSIEYDAHHQQILKKLLKKPKASAGAKGDGPTDILEKSSTELQVEADKRTITPAKTFYPCLLSPLSEIQRQRDIYSRPQLLGIDETQRRVVSRGLYMLPITTTRQPCPFCGKKPLNSLLHPLCTCVNRYREAWVGTVASGDYFKSHSLHDIDVPVVPFVATQSQQQGHDEELKPASSPSTNPPTPTQSH